MKKNYLYLCGILILILLRFTALDQDGHPRPIMGMKIEDEPYYVSAAVYANCKSIGTYKIDVQKIEIPVNMGRGIPFTWASLRVIGNNYWGLRVPVVLISLLAIALMYLIFKRLKLPHELIFLGFIFLLTDYSFMSISRYQNPQIYSYLWLVCCLMLFTLPQFKLKWLAMGIVVSGIFMFNYLLEFYIYAGIGLFILIHSIRLKEYSKLLQYIAGTSITFFSFAVYLHFHQYAVIEYLKVFADHRGGMDDKLGSAPGLMNLYTAAFQIAATNFMRFNPTVLVLFITISAVTVTRWVRERKVSDLNLFLFCICFMCFVQSIFISSYAYKKLIVLQPIILLLILVNYYNLLKEFKRSKVYISILFIASILVCIFLFRITGNESYWTLEQYEKYINVGIKFVILAVCFSLAFIIAMIVTSGPWRKYILGFILIAPSVFMVVNVFWLQRSFYYRDTLVKLKPKLENELILNGMTLDWQFYTNASPGFNPYLKFNKAYSAGMPELENIAIKVCKNMYSIERMPLDTFYAKLANKQLLQDSDTAYLELNEMASMGNDCLVIFKYKK